MLIFDFLNLAIGTNVLFNIIFNCVHMYVIYMSYSMPCIFITFYNCMYSYKYDIFKKNV